jgi:hypothetical protein
MFSPLWRAFTSPRLSPTTTIALFFVVIIIIIIFFFSSILSCDNQGSKFPKVFPIYPLIVVAANLVFYFLRFS